jgi:hypothetical protein
VAHAIDDHGHVHADVIVCVKPPRVKCRDAMDRLAIDEGID